MKIFKIQSISKLKEHFAKYNDISCYVTDEVRVRWLLDNEKLDKGKIGFDDVRRDCWRAFLIKGKVESP